MQILCLVFCFRVLSNHVTVWKSDMCNKAPMAPPFVSALKQLQKYILDFVSQMLKYSIRCRNEDATFTTKVFRICYY